MAVPRPKLSELPSPQVQDFRKALTAALRTKDDQGRVVGNAKFGIYAFYDFDGEPIYVGQTNEKLSTRIRRHLTNQRTDAVAMRVLDIFEVRTVQMWPLWDMEGLNAKDTSVKAQLNEYEYSAYVQAIQQSRFHAILNEKIPIPTTPVQLPSSYTVHLVPEGKTDERWHPDVRIARRAETIGRLAAVVRERGEVSDGLRRVLVIQAVRLAWLAAQRLGDTRGIPELEEGAINSELLVGDLLAELPGAVDEQELEKLELEA